MLFNYLNINQLWGHHPGLGRGKGLFQSGEAFVSLGGRAHPDTGEDQ